MASTASQDYVAAASHAPGAAAEDDVFPHNEQHNLHQQVSQQEDLTAASRVIFGALPDDFLRLMVEVPVRVDEVPPALLADGPMQGLLRVDVLQARLAKNYGVMKMDPFVRLIAGPYFKRTPVCQKGATEPRWNHSITLPILPFFQTLVIEVFDFRAMGDKLIGRCEVPLTEFMEGTPKEEWYHLSGKQGEDKEGVVHLNVHFERTAHPPIRTQPGPTAYGSGLPYHGVPGGSYPQPQQPAHPHPPATAYYGTQGRGPAEPSVPSPNPTSSPAGPPTAPTVVIPTEQVQQLREMFPDLDEEVIHAVIASCGNDTDAALTTLLGMAS
ncbi:uncharacterized protein MONBRDRAFT_38093 [Monosiga brevicollis MX1]|uniref:CUE domain-containing protein n=1 Tax=Monosiga brevicollis TaxID=81824 RepID=A9V5M2_MONBE|nr:uncharacterized protein MONBRDRAFT_38093 [Monosiga brevicollis MX1]EDQ87065.1 predicted protein [Monosiga brevicollis MX1]|eukprot:XP_001748008.1 hypothetical protein [Monosiga brevicollis MX1]